MKPQEKKYRVDSFRAIEKLLEEKHAKKRQEVVSTHYYGQHEGNDVEKFVAYEDRFEIHVLKESGGRFTMTEHKSIASKNDGFRWLRNKGYTHASIVKMVYTEYDYKNGTVGLYTINEFLHSVILYYPPDEHDEMEKEFGLQDAEVITVPFNMYLNRLGRLEKMKL